MVNEEMTASFEPPAYCVVLIEDDRVVVHYHDFMDTNEKFKMHSSPFTDWAIRPSGA